MLLVLKVEDNAHEQSIHSSSPYTLHPCTTANALFGLCCTFTKTWPCLHKHAGPGSAELWILSVQLQAPSYWGAGYKQTVSRAQQVTRVARLLGIDINTLTHTYRSFSPAARHQHQNTETTTHTAAP